MKLYRGLPGYDLESRIHRALDDGADWLTENILMGCAVLVFLIAAIHVGWYWSTK